PVTMDGVMVFATTVTGQDCDGRAASHPASEPCLEILGLTCLVLGSVFAVLDNVWPATKMTSGSARAQTLIPDILTLAG
ncbi:hypothetical protein BaRGS_00035551, partial [Batillaria attramentaria]